MNMDEDTIRKVVETVMRELDNSVPLENYSFKSTFLIVKSPNTNYDTIKQLKQKVNVIELANGEGEIPKVVEEVIFLDTTQAMFVKGALGITDTKETYILSKAIRLGLSINMIPSECFEWILDISNKKKISSYEGLFIQYMDNLSKFGAQLIDYKTLFKLESVDYSANNKQFNNINEKLLTKKLVENIQTNKINISHSTLVTPLARDTAKELDKEIYVSDIKEEKI